MWYDMIPSTPLLEGTWWKGKEEKYIFCLASDITPASVAPRVPPVWPCDTEHLHVSSRPMWWSLRPPARPAHHLMPLTPPPTLRSVFWRSPASPGWAGGGSYIYSRPGGNSFSWSLEAVLSLLTVMRPLACILGDYHQWPWPAPAWPWARGVIGTRPDYHLTPCKTKMNQDKCWCRPWATCWVTSHGGADISRAFKFYNSRH